MVAAVVAACAVLGACGLILLWLQRARMRSERRLQSILVDLERHVGAMAESVARAVDTVLESAAQRASPTLSLDFDELVDALVSDVAAHTGADAVVLRVEGPGGGPIVASVGSGVEVETLDTSYGPPDERPFDSALIDWMYSPTGEQEDVQFQSALVTPLVSTTGIPGVLTAYARAGNAFGPGHAAAVRQLLMDAAVALSNARRFAELEARVSSDPVTGLLNLRGYERELGREVARADRTGRPLSVIVVGMQGRGRVESAEDGGSIDEVARLVRRVTRRTDISCRRGERELAILLPGTEESGATVLTRRLQEAARQTLAAEASNVTVGLVERRPAETPEALDTRIETTLGRTRGATVAALEDVRTASTAGASTVHSTLATGADLVRPQAADILRRDVLERLVRELGDARRFGRALAVVALEIERLDDISDDLGHDVADSVLGDIAGRLDRSVGTGSVNRLGPNAFALVLPGSGVAEAEALVDALQSSLEPPHDHSGLMLSAGITELAEDDDANATLGRAEHALWQSKQAGPGTVVVAVPNRRPTPPRQA